MKLADAEKRPGAAHWTLYDGRGGVYRARRDRLSGWWTAYPANAAAATCYSGKRLLDVRARVVAGS